MGLYSLDEGEIRDTGTTKATTSPKLRDSAVDRQNRHRSRYSPSPSVSFEDSRRSSDRDITPRGSKRHHDDDHYARSRDPRRFKVHYEDRPDDRRRRQESYEDLDRTGHAPSRLRYDEDRSRSHRSRTRSRSPYRAPRDHDRRPVHGHNSHRDDYRGQRKDPSDRSRMNGSGNGYQDMSSRQQSVSNGGVRPLPADTKIRDAKTIQGSPQQLDDSFRNGINSEKWVPELPICGQALIVARAPVEASEPVEEQLDEAALIEQRRKRRAAVLAKHSRGATPLLVQALQIGDKATSETPTRSEADVDEPHSSSREGIKALPLTAISPADRALATPEISTPSTPKEIHDPGAFPVMNDQELANDGATKTAIADDGPSAADYDPTMDMKEDRHRDEERHHHEEVGSSAYDEIKQSTEVDVPIPAVAAKKEESNKEDDDDFDMFADGNDDDDMFAEEKPEKAKPSKKSEDSAPAAAVMDGKVLNVGMLDNWDDPEGYYKVILGELLNNRYHVQANLGKGMFSGVVRATDITTKKLVAIKIIRANETMRKAGMKEIEILLNLNNADPEDKKHLIRLERYFEHKGHLCMVFEHLNINLREVLKKFGRDVGINIRAVRIYAQQMFLALSLMRKCNILHADLKPDNILVNENRSMLKVCDLGSASDATDNEITPYLVSRFYRAPEIILGMQYDFAIDVWSVGCTLYELYTGKILFVGRSNNQMLRSIMETRGKFTTKMLKKAEFAYMHFDEQANFLSVEQDKLTGRDTVKTITFVKPTRDLRTRLLGASKGLPEDEVRDLNLFIDFLEKCLMVNPEKRITPQEALKHPFINRTGSLGR